MSMSRKHTQLNSKGFTIIELLIATSVFAVTMLVLMFGVVQISRTYYKGLTESKVQDTARNIANDLSESIVLNGGNVSQRSNLAADNTGNPSTSTPEVDAWCIGGQEFDYILGFELQSANDYSKHQTANATRNTSPCIGSQAQNLWSPPSGIGLKGADLLDQNMRLSTLNVCELGTPGCATGNSSFYDIDVKVVFGDDDLLCNSGVSIAGTPSCNSSATMPTTSDFTDTPAASPTKMVKCKLQSGQQFCATAEINTIVEKRVQ